MTVSFSAVHRAISRVSITCLTVCSLLSLSFNANAHPHSWIDMTTQIQGTDKAITGFHMIWQFDPMTTAYLFDGEDMSPKHKQETLDKLAKSILNNMLSTHYFTYFYHDKTPIKYKTGESPVLTTERGKATFTFDLPLAKPYPLTQDPLKLLIFDPTYYVDISWKNRSSIELSSALAKQCQFEIVEPHPTAKEVAYATDLPADADPDDTLGQLFTQSLVLTCQPTTQP
ncbi:DUF1007 family protein [Vibrio tritonius]|uniref:DUF1007 family protein n=1 Tax=Vibrio tritonius TaxID=1435069 RepID=A0ABS7YG03_9VIBR|nr:DUF1007 family protein [Vibrio tritonius]